MTNATEKAPERRRYRGVSKEARQAERYKQLCEAGIKRIGIDGYAATTVKAVCQEAGLTERYFYESFANREALLCDTYKQITGRMRANMVAAAMDSEDTDLKDLIKATLNAFFADLEADPYGARLIMVEVLGVSDTVDNLYRRTMKGYAEMIRSLAGESFQADEANGLSEAHFNEMTNALMGGATQAGISWVLTDYATPREIMVESCHFLFSSVVEKLERI
ncbi:MAG: TetR/AcrR family transcriptional regulator [Pseudomonadota bacterium]